MSATITQFPKREKAAVLMAMERDETYQDVLFRVRTAVANAVREVLWNSTQVAPRQRAALLWLANVRFVALLNGLANETDTNHEPKVTA